MIINQQAMRVLGFIAVLSGVLRFGMTPASLVWGVDSDPELWFGLSACFAMAIGSIGIYLYQAKETGIYGLTGAILLAVGNMATGCLVWQTLIDATTADPGLLPLVNTVAMTAGILLFSITTIRARRTSIVGAILLIGLLVIGFVPYAGNYFAAVWGLAYVLMGYPVWLDRSDDAAYSYEPKM